MSKTEHSEKEIDLWAIHAALVDLHFQSDSVRKCAAINDLLERAKRNQFLMSKAEQTVKPVTAWAVVDSLGDIWPPYIGITKEIAIDSYLETGGDLLNSSTYQALWKEAQEKGGMRIVKVNITEVG